MIPIAAVQPPPSRGLDQKTRAWDLLCPKKENRRHVYAIDTLLRRGAADANWLAAVDEMLFLACQAPEAALQGYNNVVTYATCTFTGTLNHLPVIGYIRSDAADAQLTSYVRTNVNCASFGYGAAKAGQAYYCTTNYSGITREVGATGSGGLKNFTDNACNGLRGYMALGTGGVGYNSAGAWGWHCGTRLDASLIAVWRHQDKQILSAPFESLPTGNINICSAQPTSASSPNGIGVYVLHHWTEAQGDQAARDFIQYAYDSGLYIEAFSPPNVLGANCFDENDLNDIVPANRRIYRFAGFPTADGASASSYSYFPMTDSYTLLIAVSGALRDLPASAFTTTAGSNLVLITDQQFNGRVGDGVTILAPPTGQGLVAADLGGRREVVEVVSPSQFKVQADHNAAGTGALAGPSANMNYRQSTLAPTNYTIKRNGRAWCLVWENRGRTAPDNPNGYRVGGGNGYGGAPPILRIANGVDAHGGQLLAGQQCRPWFLSPEKCITATEAQIWRIMGGLANNDPDHPEGLGYMDIIAESGSAGLKRARIQKAGTFTDSVRVWGVGAERSFKIKATGPTFSASTTLSLQQKRAGDADFATIQTYHATFGLITVADPYDGEFVEYRLGVASGQFTTGDDITAQVSWGFLDATRCVTNAYAWQHSDQLFNRLQSNLAVADDLVIWYRGNLFELNRPAANKGVMMDFEPADYKDKATVRRHLLRLGDMALAKGMRMAISPNIFLPGQLQYNGLGAPELNDVINHAGWESVSILAQKLPAYPDIKVLLDQELAVLSGPLPVPLSKLMVTIGLGAGKWRVTDAGPLGSTQMALAMCDDVASWMDGKGIVHVRPSNPVGGTEDLFHNQQQEHLMKNLAAGAPPPSGDPVAQVNTWVSTVQGLGGTVSSDARTFLINLVSELMLAGLWTFDYLGWYGAEDLFGVRVDLAKFKVGTIAGAPVLTPHLHLAFNGTTDSNTTNFKASTDATNITPTDQALGFYERIGGAASSTGIHMGMARSADTSAISLMNLCSTAAPGNVWNGRLQGASLTVTSVTNPTWTGLHVQQRKGNLVQFFKRGVQFGPDMDASGFTTGAILPDRSLRVGCNTPGVGGDVPSGWRACAPAFAFVMKSCSVPQQQQLNNIFERFLGNYNAVV